MSRKDFELIARTIADMASEMSRREIAEAFADALRTTNCNFNRQRFLAACGI